MRRSRRFIGDTLNAGFARGPQGKTLYTYTRIRFVNNSRVLCGVCARYSTRCAHGACMSPSKDLLLRLLDKVIERLGDLLTSHLNGRRFWVENNPFDLSGRQFHAQDTRRRVVAYDLNA